MPRGQWKVHAHEKSTLQFTIKLWGGPVNQITDGRDGGRRCCLRTCLLDTAMCSLLG